MDKISVIVLCGGVSSEHEVSLRSANSIIQNLSCDRYDVVPVGITKQGKWISGAPLIINSDDHADIKLNFDLPEVLLKNGTLNNKNIDVVFSTLHGTFGEDGCMQGFLKMQQVAFVGPDVLGSAIGMDKDFTKRLLTADGINCAEGVVVHAWEAKKPTYNQINEKLGDVVFVKPCSLGSSVGVSKCRNEIEFNNAIDFAFKYDNKLVIEECINGREIEISVLGDENKIQVSVPGEIIVNDGFYSYEAKYLEEDTAKLVIPANLSIDIVNKISDIAIKVFRTLGCSGLSRIDFFITENELIYVNEINTLPGFTKISMYPKLWEYSGIQYPELIDRLIQLAMEEHQR